MKLTKTITALMLAAMVFVLAACGQSGGTSAPAREGPTDQELADEVTALIEAIQVQERTDSTDADCAAARTAWDALTDVQKELVDDPDYFGLDTGDASADDPRNADGIGANELLVVSFGTSFNGSRATDIKAIEDTLQAAYPDWAVRRAFTAQIIINHVQARDGEKIDNMEQALERAVANGVENLVVQPTHLMHGAEYDELSAAVEKYRGSFKSVVIAEPLLGEVGADATVVNADKKAVAEAVVAAAVAEAGCESLARAEADGVAFVLMGHGTAHVAKVTYSQMQAQMEALGYKNVFIGTVEGEPEDTACEAVIDKVAAAGYKTAVLRPLMVVAGDHANNDMAGPDEDSWLSMFSASGRFDDVQTQIAGLGRITDIQALYVAHTGAAIEAAGIARTAGAAQTIKTTAALPDGAYSAEFHTDSSMFHANEATKGMGVLTVQDGQMTIHVSLASKSIVNLYPGTAEEAQAEGAVLLEPTLDTVTYDDGISEEVYGFDVPVPHLDEEFPCALIGKKGVWYDHMVSVSNPEPMEAESAA